MPIYFFSVTRERLAGLQDAPLRWIPLEDTASDLNALAQIDAVALAVSREKHHRYLLNDDATKGVTFCAGGARVGYAYISSDGHIGPLAVTRADALGPAFMSALTVAANGGSAQVSAFLPGTCDMALSLASPLSHAR